MRIVFALLLMPVTLHGRAY